MYVSSAYSRCFISSLILISRYDHHESVASSHIHSVSALVFSHSLSLSHVTLVVCPVCIVVYLTLLSVYLYFFFFYIKYRISDDLTKLYPGINVLCAAREGDRSRRKVLHLSCVTISRSRLVIFAVGTFNYLLSPRFAS